MKHLGRLLLVALQLLSAACAAATSLTVVVVPNVAAVRTTDYTTSPYIFIQIPDPNAPPSQNPGGALFEQVPSSLSATNNGCVNNFVTVVVDMAGNCFIRTDKLNIRDFGARGDTRSGFTDGYFPSPTTFASASAAFTKADIGKHIYIQGAGSIFTPVRFPGNPKVGPNYQTFDTTISNVTAASGSNPAYVTIAAQPAGSIPATMWGSIPGASASSQGTGYSVGDILPLAGGNPLTAGTTYCQDNKVAGSATCAATVKVNAVTVVGATVATTTGSGTHSLASCTLTGASGTALSGQLFQVLGSTDANGTLSITGVKMNGGGYYTSTPASPAATNQNCGFTSVTLTLSLGVAETQMVFNGIYSSQQFPSSPAGVGPSPSCTAACSGATFTTSTSQQENVFSVGTDDTPALQAAVAAQTKIASLSVNPTNMNSKACIYAPAGIYSVLPLNQSGLTGILAANACVEGDGQQQTIFHVRPNVAGDLFAWHNAGQNNSLPFNGSIGLLNLNQAGSICRDFGVEGDRTSSAEQNALVFYGANDYISCTDVQVDFLLGSALRCADPDPNNLTETAQCRESHFHDLRFTRDGDGANYPVISWTANGGTDGDNNLDISDIDIYNPRGTGMYFSDTATGSGNADHNISMARVRWEGSEFSVAGITTDLLQIDGGAVKSMPPPAGGTSYITCLACRWENPYFGASAIHFSAGTSNPPPSNVVLDGRVIGNQFGFGKGVVIDAGTSLVLNLSFLSTVDYDFSITNSSGTNLNNIFLNGYGAETGWTYNVPTASGALIGPIQRIAVGANSSAILTAQPNAANGCTGTRGPGAADLQSDFTLATQGALGKDAFTGAGQANTASGNYASTTSGQSNTASGNFTTVSGGTGNVASGNYAAISGGNGNTASGTYSLSGGASANDYGRLATNCWSSTASGFSQTCVETLVANGSVTPPNPLRLTANGPSIPNATNTFNIPANTAFSLRVSLTAIDTVSMATYAATWTGALNLSRGATTGTTALNGGVSVAPSSTYPSPSSPIASLSADTTYGGLAVSFLPPNSDTWHVSARAESTEVK